MKIADVAYRSVMPVVEGSGIRVLDQRWLPWEARFVTLDSCENAALAIREMWVRGAPLIGAVAAYGLCFALREDAGDAALDKAYAQLLGTRPTAVNLRWALERMKEAVAELPPGQRVAAAFARAAALCDEDAALCAAIGQHGLGLMETLALKHPGRALNILTHCNAGWLATVDFGTALAPLYMAHDAGMKIHVWVDETRPRNQGALTAFELAQHGVPHSFITDNAGGLLMQQGKVDICIVGADRVTRNGDVCNKIGTYLKALAARDCGVPFYVAVPYATLDATLVSGADIPIEERNPAEVTDVTGRTLDGRIETVRITASPAINPAFDVTPARLVTGYITERGVLSPQELHLQAA
jgi:methylthioribose-1-phosphate isomerase